MTASGPGPSTSGPSARATRTPLAEVEVLTLPAAVGWRRRYRWRVTWYAPTDPVHPGVFDGRRHLVTDSGFAPTRALAWRRLARSVERGPR